MKSTSHVLSRRYAQASVNVFGDDLTLDLAKTLPLLADAIEAQRSVLIYAGLKEKYEESKQQLENLFTAAGFKEHLFGPLIDLVADQRRIELLPSILRSIYDLYLEKQGIMHFTIESAVTLKDDQCEAFIAFLKKKTDKKIEYTLVVNPALIAGVKIYSDTLGFEHSIQQRLSEISPHVG